MECMARTGTYKSDLAAVGRLTFMTISFPPDIEDSLSSSDVITREGNNVTLSCSANGSPEPTIKWRRDDGQMININKSYSSNSLSLILTTRLGVSTEDYVTITVTSISFDHWFNIACYSLLCFAIIDYFKMPNNDNPLGNALKTLAEVSEFSILRKDLKINLLKAIDDIQNYVHYTSSILNQPTRNETINETTNLTPSYSQVSKPNRKLPLFNLIIKSKSKKDAEVLKREFKTVIKPKDLQIGINKISAKKDSIIVETNTPHEREIIQQKLQNAQDLVVRQANRRKPKLIFKDIDEEVTIENFTEHLVKQNAALEIDPSSIRPVIFLKNRRNNRIHAVIETDAATRTKLIYNKIGLGHKKHWAEDYWRIRRCTKCCKFHHSEDQCQGTTTFPTAAAAIG
ncbi:unnamed protein product [Nezara viridula]|uniref:Ig-like domain-containing protein n=1 Tax=Nezara viridula TaxID=85310 RepID=A0A9P0H3Y1_NEZVI|nr:unnamed protein product [Nezara viridula]